MKTTDTYSIRTATLVGYVDDLISEARVPSWERTLGLYVLGRADSASGQIANAIVAERRTHQLRLISTEFLLSLAELMATYDVEHSDILAVLRPSEPVVDSIIDLMARLVAQRATEGTADGVAAIAVTVPITATPPVDPHTVTTAVPSQTGIPFIQGSTGTSAPAYWLTPVKSDEVASAEDTIRGLVGEAHAYAFGDKTPGRKRLKPQDWICFYANGIGVIGHAKVASAPEQREHPRVRNPERYPWVFALNDEVLYTDEPVVIDADLRARLEGFKGKDPNKSWSWFVQATHELREHDFAALTRRPKHV